MKQILWNFLQALIIGFFYYLTLQTLDLKILLVELFDQLSYLENMTIAYVSFSAFYGIKLALIIKEKLNHGHNLGSICWLIHCGFIIVFGLLYGWLLFPTLVVIYCCRKIRFDKVRWESSLEIPQNNDVFSPQ